MYIIVKLKAGLAKDMLAGTETLFTRLASPQTPPDKGGSREALITAETVSQKDCICAGPEKGCFGGRPDEHLSGFKWQRAPAAQLGKSGGVFLRDTECFIGRQQN